MHQCKVGTDVVDDWWYWEFEEYIKMLNKKNDEAREAHRKQEEQQKASGGSPNMNVSNLMSKAKGFLR